MAVVTSSLNVRLQTALSQPIIAVRCEEVARILSEATTKDAGYILRGVVESIFVLNTPSTVQGYAGWGLRFITRSAHPREFEQLRAFLGANGPLLSLIFRLASDPYMVFEFPVSCLPAKSRLEIEEGSPGAFYVNKVQHPGPGKVPCNILLNAFEYYLFHFAHFLVGSSGGSSSNSSSTGSTSPTSQRWTLTWSTAGDALYPTLLEEYLLTFLPCDGSLPPGPPSPPVSPRGVLAARPSLGPPNLYMSGYGGSPITSRGLHHLGQSPHPSDAGAMLSGAAHGSSLHLHHHSAVIGASGAVGGAATSSNCANQPNSLSVWSSQVLIQVFIEMLVNQCLPPSTSTTRPSSGVSRPPHHHPMSSSVGQYTMVRAGIDGSLVPFSEYIPLEYRPFWHSVAPEVFVPSSDHVRVVRMLIKHLHFFANSGKVAQPSPLDSLRKNIWNIYRKSLYQFLVHTFKHWPLDSSFRLVLETWLSYIQPWRYSDSPPSARSPTNTQTANTMEGETRAVEGRWQVFVAENLLFYSLLFHHLLLRLFRLDLSAPKNAQILFRVTKVFSQPNLSRYIQEIESALEDPHWIHLSMITPSSATPNLGHKGLGSGSDARSLASLARSHCVEVEGPGQHSYLPMFGAANVSLVNSLMKHVRSAYETVVSEQHQQQEQEIQQQSTFCTSGGKGGWWRGLVKSMFESSITTEEESSVEDVRKTVVHLDMAQRHLCSVFGISPYEINVGSGDGGCGGNNNSYNQQFLPMARGNTGMDTSFTTPHHTMFSKHHHVDSIIPDQMDTPEGPILSPYGQHQLRYGFRRRDIKYEGDPDLRPICSYEVAFLVRWLYAVCCVINAKYGDKITSAYHKQDITGWLARLILQGPETIFEYHKECPDAPASRTGRHLPPRLSLRTQASKAVVLYELLFCGVVHLFGLWGFLLKLFVIVVILISVPAYLVNHYLHTRQTHTPVTTTTPVTTAAHATTTTHATTAPASTLESSPGL